MSEVYVIFSRTESKVGSFIRVMTHGHYNHVSIAFDPHLDEMYSFSRIKYRTPFCGGFVREGAERYRIGGHAASIAVCSVETDERHLAEVRRLVTDMTDTHDRYVYNILSAIFVPLRFKVRVRDSYTCVEFALLVLQTAGVSLGDRLYSADDLYGRLDHHIVYEGEYPQNAAVADLAYTDEIPIKSCIARSVRQIWRVVYRLVRR